jgi:hypothetical protein
MMKSATIYEQLKCISEKLKVINASDIDGVEDVFKDLLHCENDTMKFYDEIKGEILKIHNEEVTDAEFRKKMDAIVNKMIDK